MATIAQTKSEDINECEMSNARLSTGLASIECRSQVLEQENTGAWVMPGECRSKCLEVQARLLRAKLVATAVLHQRQQVSNDRETSTNSASERTSVRDAP